MSSKQDRINAYWAQMDAQQGTYSHSSGGGSVQERRTEALKKSRGRQKRGLLERMAQAEVNKEMRKEIARAKRRGGTYVKPMSSE